MSQLYQEANDLFIEEEYSQALSCYDRLLAEATNERSSVAPITLAEYYNKRSLVHQKLNQLQLSSSDSLKCIELLEKEDGSSKLIIKAFYRLGLCEFKLGNFQTAQEALLKAQILGSSEKDLISMLEICNEKLPKPQELSEPQSEPAPLPISRIRHEWYQTDSHVFVSVFIKKVKPENATVEFAPREFTVSVKQPSGSDVQFSIEPLAQEIDVSQSTYSILSTKIELSLKKANIGIKWGDLEGDETNTTEAVSSAKEFKPTYPTSSRKAKNWDALSKEAEKESENDESNPNSIFQKIFKDSDEDTRRAMMKSFTESNGTCLSTDWKDVSRKKVETSPPDGMEARKWN